MIRFEREGEERVAHWIGGGSWRSQRSLERLFGEAHSDAHSGTAAEDETGMGEAPPETARLWCNAVKTMGPDELESFAERTFRQWDRSPLSDLRRNRWSSLPR